MKKKILFISNQTSKTGAPYVLLFLLKWIRKNINNVEIHFLALTEGNISDEFRSQVDCYYSFPGKKINSIWERIFIYVFRNLFGNDLNKYKEKRIFKSIAKNNYNLIYANTVVSLGAAVSIKNFQEKKCKLIVHVHEMETVIKTSVPEFKEYTNDVDCFIAVSMPVKSNLNERYNIPLSKLKLVYEFSDVKNSPSKNRESNKKFIVGASGLVHWRKGDDIFIQVARYIHDHYPECDIQFVWVGFISPFQEIIISEDLKKANLSDNVKFIGEKSNPLEYFADFDIFFLPSREDPFPLVCIETGMLGIPIICFEKATGIADVLQEGGGYIAPYLNIEAVAEKIIIYYNDRNLVVKDGQICKDKFSRFTPDKICPEIYRIIVDTDNDES